jgi:gamma-D-glutamyl-L-lysine dipeptidyl-peptidase
MNQKAYCKVGVAAVMQEPNHKCEQETQILFGESIEIIETFGDWIQLKADWDAYEGFALAKQFVMVDTVAKAERIIGSKAISIAHDGANILLPSAASLPFFKDGQCTIANVNYNIQESIALYSPTQFLPEHILPIVKSYLQTSYFWGGRTHAGIDCSGFSAVLYKYFNIPMMHKASWQAQQGEIVDFLQQAQCGDLAFFDDEQGDITHVGIMLDDATIIHASEVNGGVAIDDIDNEGILNRVTKKRTHHLRMVRRML